MSKLSKMAVVLGIMSACACVTWAQEQESATSVVAPQEAGTWSDMTAMFRPSRWRHPLSEGGTLSWLNYKVWAAAPWRTTKVLAGELITLGGTYYILEAFGVIGATGSGGGGAVGAGAGAGGGGEMPF
jgi:hypothetical protein